VDVRRRSSWYSQPLNREHKIENFLKAMALIRQTFSSVGQSALGHVKSANAVQVEVDEVCISLPYEYREAEVSLRTKGAVRVFDKCTNQGTVCRFALCVERLPQGADVLSRNDHEALKAAAERIAVGLIEKIPEGRFSSAQTVPVGQHIGAMVAWRSNPNPANGSLGLVMVVAIDAKMVTFYAQVKDSEFTDELSVLFRAMHGLRVGRSRGEGML
jgi:hypothetical protein